ncbi:28 kDa outer membrane protein [Bacteroidales bacterium Barb7]|nr:28 kDa outer membrane protein [Bacteroidales bacterium Barb7]
MKNSLLTTGNKASALLFIVCLFLSACSSGKKEQVEKDENTLVIGVNQYPTYSDMLKQAIVPLLEKKGYKVVLKEISDVYTANMAVNNFDLDLYVGQHNAYLNFFLTQNKYDISPLIVVPSALYGIYSAQIKAGSAEELKQQLKKGDIVGIPNDPSNLSRTLIFLENLGLIKIRAGADKSSASEFDIEENPYGLVFRYLPSTQIVRSLNSITLGAISGPEAQLAGILDKFIINEIDPNEDFLVNFIINNRNLNERWANDFIGVIESEEFKNVIEDPTYNFKKYYHRPDWYVRKWNTSL